MSEANEAERQTKVGSCALLAGREAAGQQRHRRSSATVGRAERGCHSCRYRAFDVLSQPCVECETLSFSKWQPRGERSLPAGEWSGPANTNLSGAASASARKTGSAEIGGNEA